MNEIWKEFQPINLIVSSKMTLVNLIRAYIQCALAVATLYGVCRIAGMGFAHGLGL